MTELLSELKDACHRMSPSSEEAIIGRGESTWFRGLPAQAEKGTIALGLGAARVIISERDIRGVTKDGDYYNVEVSADANVLVRLDKVVKAAAQHGCRCDPSGAGTHHTHTRPQIVDIEIGPITVCDLLCADVVIDNGRQSVKVEICIPVNCRIERLSSR